MRLRELKESGHAPSLFAAFLHFDISFMVWVILGALMPFLVADPSLTGANLEVTPTSMIRKAGQVTLVIKAADLKRHQPRNIVNLLLKPGDAAIATRQSTKPLEKYVLDTSNPATLAQINARSSLIRVRLAQGVHENPNETVIPLLPLKALGAEGRSFQVVANGYPASTKLALVGLPLLAAAFWRILLGLLADRFGSKGVGMGSLILTLLPLILGWKYGNTYTSLEFIGFFLGVAGASFAVALPLASRWYPPQQQGLAMGIAGAGNSGTILATLFAPMLAKIYGWHVVMGLLCIPVLLTFGVFAIMAKNPPGREPSRRLADYLVGLTRADCWWFCLLYFVTFGGFVGMSSFFNSFFVDQYDAPKAMVGLWTAPFILAGSFVRPVGGFLADRLGGVRMLTLLYSTVILCAVGVGLFITNFAAASVLLLMMMAALGMGNGSVFQLVPQRFRKEIGVITGFVGAAGGTGGYYLNFALGHLHDVTDTYASGFFAFAGIAVLALAGLRIAAPGWFREWLGEGGRALSPDSLMAPGQEELAAAHRVTLRH